ncbi:MULTISPECIES: DNA internalization-related competence protein ComEC/Rec2 [unclassified Enterococcus]|uniref:DNA internalization-related competence protein ComEC/Rec2 n=1 Tax=unclassified Enterococcus TaxID=2608891 RepID=UPI0013EC0784|nr:MULTISPECIES: DNA internalization-related competence protein ComEC/Rec2 [unclassified Enterococcus]
MYRDLGEQVQNRLIFPAMTSIGICLFYYTDDWYYRVVLVGLFFWVTVKEGREITCLCLFFSFFVLVSCWRLESPEVNIEEKKEHFLLSMDTLRTNGNHLTVAGRLVGENQKVQLSYYAEKEEEIHEWLSFRGKDIELTASGEYIIAEPQRNQYGFDQIHYDKVHRIAGRFKVTHIEKIDYRNTWRNFLQRKRGTFLSFVQNNFPEKTGIYLNALLFGFKDARFADSEEIFKETGLLHLFSLSGMHIQCYLGWMYYLFRRSGFTLEVSILPMTVLTIGYFGIAGGSVSVLRAGILFLLQLATKLLGLKCSSLDLYALTLWLVLLIEPLSILQVGGQLSFLISFMIIMIPAGKGSLLHRFVSGGVFSLAIMPITVWHFYEWPIFSGLLTFMFSSFFKYILLPVTVFLFSFGQFLPDSSLLLFESGLEMFEQFAGRFAFAKLIIGKPSIYLLLSYVLAILVVQEKMRKKPVKTLFLSISFSSVFVFSRFFDSSSSISYIDVGQGDSILLRSPRYQEIVLIDTGGKLSFEGEAWQKRVTKPYAEYNVVPFLKGQGISRINKLILTHDDTDHVGELKTLAKHFVIDTIYIGWGAGTKPPLKEKLMQLASQGTMIIEVKQSDQISGFFEFFVLTPNQNGEGKNEDSIGLWLEHQGLKFLFLGDLDQEMEREIVRTYPHLRADVVKLGHHGSRSSTDSSVLTQIEARHGIVSCGKNNRYGHPHEEVLTALEENQMMTLRTDEQGMINYKWHPIWYPEGKLQTMID